MTTAASAKTDSIYLDTPVTFETSYYRDLVVVLPLGAVGGAGSRIEMSGEEKFKRQVMDFRDGKYIATTQDEVDRLKREPYIYERDMTRPHKCRGCERIYTSTDAWSECEASHAPVRSRE